MTQTKLTSIPGETKRIPELDGLRGTAIAMVLCYHYFTDAATFIKRPNLVAYLQIATRLNWSGVDLFFVLSGFLIGGILLNARESKNYFKVFYLRRACRILPIYMVFCIFIALCYRIVDLSNQDTWGWLFNGALPWYSYLTFTQNFWMAHFNFLGPASLSITWSLAVEEQFYLTLPAVIRFVRGPKLLWVLVTGIVTAPIIRVAVAIGYPQFRDGLYVLLPCRMDSLLLGVLVAYLLPMRGIREYFFARRKILWFLFSILALGLGYFLTTSNMYAFPMATIGYDWLALFYLTALVLVLIDTNCWLARVMRWRWLMGLGAVAYSLYLFHFVVYGLCMGYLRGHAISLQNLSDLGVTLVSLGLVIGLAKLSWRFFEKPIIRWGHEAQYEAK